MLQEALLLEAERIDRAEVSGVNRGAGERGREGRVTDVHLVVLEPAPVRTGLAIDPDNAADVRQRFCCDEREAPEVSGDAGDSDDRHGTMRHHV